ncbi:MAG: sulfotransferase family protein [Kiritimatiellia bacterium]
MRVEPVIDRPVFIVGMPRSGTTALRDLLFLHDDFCSTTNVTRKFPGHYGLMRLAALFIREHRPLEAGSMWDRFCNADSDELTADDVTPEARAYFTRAVGHVLRLYDRPRFLSKCPRNGLRIGFLASIFPGACFIHLVRDGRAVCRSVLEKRRKNGGERQWWDAKPAGWKAAAALDPVASVARQWREVVDRTAANGRDLPASQFMEARYEDFTAAPLAMLDKINTFCGLNHPPGEHQVKACMDIKSRNDKWSASFTAGEVDVLNEIMGPTLKHYGYLT